ncbi:MAG: NADPH-dependent assimilatory sulfite reductase flavoprotein subunit, partial [Neisseria sp.]|nr:NADPH-dependent assimilatory sulfite reductase flavoprotein subunit [Neisseria sp.]
PANLLIIETEHEIAERAAEFWNWRQKGAHIYVCGDATRMARDVESALIEVIETQGKLSRDEAEDYLKDLREDKRYQRDVY